MLLPNIATDVVNVTRRENTLTASRDSLNNPSYGNPSDWLFVYTNIKVRITFSGKSIAFDAKGELITPSGQVYFDKQYDIRAMDRFVTVDCPGLASGIEYVITEVFPVFYGHGIISHYVAKIELPVL